MEGFLDLAVVMVVPALLMAAQRRRSEETLDGLFARLRTSKTAAEARVITERIWACWHDHADPDVRALMQHGVRALEDRRYDEALRTFDAIVQRDPGYAEGWNKRATVRYLLGQYAGSVRDVKRTLALEPRHFGALSGLGTIYLIIANDRGALDAFEAVLALNPHLDGVRRQVDALRKALDEEKGRADDGA